jgi:DNA repair protein RecO (recombination protein O)
MITRTKAIVIHQVKYSETSIIATFYTEAFGRQSYIINGIRNPKSKQKAGIIQPLFLLEIEAYHKSGREIQRLKEFRPDFIFQSLPFDPVKRAVTFFLAELLSKILRNEESEPELFNFICHSIKAYDEMEQGTANFHLWFFASLLGHLGLQPNNNYSETYQWFDLKNGKFLITRPLQLNTPNPEHSRLLSELFAHKMDTLFLIEMNGAQRKKLLEYLIEYYTIHFERIGKINSLTVLSELFHS